MSPVNLYATLNDYKAYVTARGQTPSLDTNDDSVILDLLEAASRYLDNKSGRQFYPSIETRLYDVPFDSELWLDGDLLQVTTLTNGNAVVISSNDYLLESVNMTPYYLLKIRDSSTVTWESNSAGSSENVISLLGYWGYRRKYSQRAWVSGGTLGAAITDTTTLAFTMTAGHTLENNQIVKIDNEIYNVVTVSENTVTPMRRGDNGSTAATHSNGAAVSIWYPQEEAKNAVLEIANNAYQRRFGKATGESATITAAGIVITPRDIPAMAEEFIRSFMRYV